MAEGSRVTNRIPLIIAGDSNEAKKWAIKNNVAEREYVFVNSTQHLMMLDCRRYHVLLVGNYHRNPVYLTDPYFAVLRRIGIQPREEDA